MEPIPTEWVDKLFNCMGEFYGNRWHQKFKKPNEQEMDKTVWKNGLVGLTYDEIKAALVLCKKSARDPREKPPHVMEFFRYAKRQSQPFINPKEKPIERGDPEIAREHIKEIRKKVGSFDIIKRFVL